MYKVVKEYAGVKVGTEVKCTDKSIADYMVSRRYWEFMPEPEPKAEPEPKRKPASANKRKPTPKKMIPKKANVKRKSDASKKDNIRK